MTVNFGSAGTTIDSTQSVFASQKDRKIEASFAGAGVASISIRSRMLASSSPAGAGNFSINPQGGSRLQANATLRGSSTLSAVDDIIGMQVDFEVMTTLQANATNPVATLMGNPKSRLVFAVEINTLPIG